ncbi:MAG: flagellar basal body-associated FliL family protein [Xanthobacteraceae bacterium]
MASKVTTAPADLEEEEEGKSEGKAAAGGSFIGRLLGRFKGLSRKQMIIYGGALLLLIGLGIGAFMFLRGGAKHEEMAAPKAVYHELPEMLVNLAAGNERPQYLRVKITLEVENAAVVEVLRPAMPRVIDTFQVHLRELRAGDLEGSAGLFRLREELTRRVNHAIAPVKIRAVLFREIVVQ